MTDPFAIIEDYIAQGDFEAARRIIDAMEWDTDASIRLECLAARFWVAKFKAVGRLIRQKHDEDSRDDYIAALATARDEFDAYEQFWHDCSELASQHMGTSIKELTRASKSTTLGTGDPLRPPCVR